VARSVDSVETLVYFATHGEPIWAYQLLDALAATEEVPADILMFSVSTRSNLLKLAAAKPSTPLLKCLLEHGTAATVAELLVAIQMGAEIIRLVNLPTLRKVDLTKALSAARAGACETLQVVPAAPVAMFLDTSSGWPLPFPTFPSLSSRSFFS